MKELKEKMLVAKENGTITNIIRVALVLYFIYIGFYYAMLACVPLLDKMEKVFQNMRNSVVKLFHKEKEMIRKISTRESVEVE
ncbi:MAG: hypothetical protein NC548_47490 [Lachnospiraceae bacterium]|nr:hypothetical protein [Lachnospiraceae bacterium]